MYTQLFNVTFYLYVHLVLKKQITKHCAAKIVVFKPNANANVKLEQLE